MHRINTLGELAPEGPKNARMQQPTGFRVRLPRSEANLGLVDVKWHAMASSCRSKAERTVSQVVKRRIVQPVSGPPTIDTPTRCRHGPAPRKSCPANPYLHPNLLQSLSAVQVTTILSSLSNALPFNPDPGLSVGSLVTFSQNMPIALS